MLDALPRIPLIEDLTVGSVPPGSNLLVEFDPSSQWYNTALTIAAGWIKQEGNLLYHSYIQRPENIRLKLQRLGLQVENIEKEGKLRILDWYTCQLGQKSKEKFAVPSLKVADLSIWILKEWMPSTPIPGVLEISDNTSAVARFNDEKAWVEYVVTRILPTTSIQGMINIRGLMKGVHSDWVYKQLEGAHDGVIDLKVEEEGKTTRDLIRIRNMRDVGFNREWHELRIGENSEISLVK